MRKVWILGILLAMVGIALWWSQTPEASSEISETTPIGRWEYERMRLADPATGEIPEDIRMRELAFASNLPKVSPASRDSFAFPFKHIGPYNVGGRTRAFKIDQYDPDVFLAGGVSGGMWRSADGGQSWQRVTEAEDHPATSCVVQDIREGNSDTWYFGSGETVGNSASKSFSAYYRGSGIWKSTDRGLTWTHLQSTSALAQKASDWDAVWSMAVDHTRNDSDIVFAAIKLGIMRSNDGGETWKEVLPTAGNPDFTSIDVTPSGIFYATIASNATQNKGFWRSEDGVNWVKIIPGNHPGAYERTIIAIAESNDDVVYFFSGTPGTGVNDASLWKYEYLSGDGSGSGGAWTNLTPGLASADFDVYGGYCQVAAVKPDNEDVVFVGGTSLYRSMNGFADTFQVARIGGYSIDGDENYTYFRAGGAHYPDQQNIDFHPNNPDIIISTTDGGVHFGEDCTKEVMSWQSLNNGYITTQFYAIAIDHGTPGSEVVVGGLQDRGTWWTDEDATTYPWTHLRGADGAYCEIEDGAGHYYISTQYANIQRSRVRKDGSRTYVQNIMPEDVNGGWLFVHPFTLDRVNNDIMYLPQYGRIWRNDTISCALNGTLQDRWAQICDVGNTVSAISSSDSDEGVVYFGTSNGQIFRLDSAHIHQNPFPKPLSDSLYNTGYTSCIAIDPHDPDRAMVVFSNYNCRSIWYTEDGGADWEEIEGNLKGTPDPNVPAVLDHIGDGPSIRWAEFVPTEGGYLYVIGTSVGLYSTNNLQGDSTVWVQQGAQTIGNVVVDMLHYRESDGKLVVGTHGNGIFAANLKYFEVGKTELVNLANDLRFEIFPNPAVQEINITLNTEKSGAAQLKVLDVQGRTVLLKSTALNAGRNKIPLNVSKLATGTYFLSTETEMGAVTKKFVKR